MFLESRELKVGFDFGPAKIYLNEELIQFDRDKVYSSMYSKENGLSLTSLVGFLLRLMNSRPCFWEVGLLRTRPKMRF